LIFDDPTQSEFNTSTSAGEFIQGWGQALESAQVKTDPMSDFGQHTNGQGVFKVVVNSATQSDYDKWAASATSVPPTGTTSVPTTTPTSVPFSSVPVPTATSYDYVIIGGGAAGIPIADKLSESGKSVLLIEKGIASSARWGGSK
jgi:cellobiose dehydrogenase (acceptor)